MRKDSAWESIIREAYAASRGLGIPTIGMDDGYVLYSTAFLVSLRFGRLKAMDAGAGAGFSTVWIARAILESGIEGNVHAVEKTSQRFKSLKSLVAKHHLEGLITPVNGDAFDHAGKVEELNLVFIDIEKEQYLDFFRLIKSRIPRGGVVLAHNVNHPYGTVEVFLKEASQGVWRTIIVPTQAGISISVKTG
ncbi:MAG: class I SAM-dependent methyltransferase [Thermoproteota archaeon]|nr:class I SAM-dependent methyltransferase [Candidatus Brockarchaeota archaeon]